MNMKHVDGTTCCKTRKGMPSRQKIAFYWRDTSWDYFGYSMEWQEPFCWACGTFDGSLDMDQSGQKGIAVFRVWENHGYLQRCHVVPKSLGGCNCEANLVLLCARCHRESPDTKDPIHFQNWVRNKKKMFHQEIQNTMTLLGYTAEATDWKLLISEQFKNYYLENSVVVGGCISISTFIASFMEFKAEIIESGIVKEILSTVENRMRLSSIED